MHSQTVGNLRRRDVRMDKPDSFVRVPLPADAALEASPSRRSLPDLDVRAVASLILRSSAFWGLVLAVATWAGTGASLKPKPGLDPSWQASLYMQAHLGLAAGSHGVFTYGPLGFLTITRLYYPGLALLALIYSGALAASVYGLLVSGIRRFAPLPVAVVAALLAGAPMVILNQQVEGWISVGCCCAVYIIRQPADRPAAAGWWAALGVLAGVNILTKTTVGVYLVLACLVVLACAPRGKSYRPVYVLIGSGAATFVIGWVGTGNGPSGLISFVKGAVSVTSGYASAVYSRAVPPNAPPLFWMLRTPYSWWLMAVAAVVLGALAIIAWPRLGQEPATLAAYWRRFRVGAGVSLVLGLPLVFLYKEAVILQGPRDYFAALPILFVAAAFIGRPARLRALERGGLMAVVFAAAVVAYLGNNAGTTYDVTKAVGIGRFVDQVTTVLAHSGPKISHYRAALQAHYALPPEVLARIGDGTVAIDTWENTVAWAYPQLRWDPLPVIQDYAAYTTYLDKLNASFLTSSRAPAYVLRRPDTIDGRSATLDPPQTQLELACRYKDIAEFNGWQLLQSTPDRCGTPTPIGTVSAGYGETITVPSAPAGDMIVATFSLHKGLSWDLQNLLYRPPGFGLRINDSSGVIRFISGTAGDMHMIRAPEALGWGRGFAPVPISTMTITEAGVSARSGVVVHFYAIPMR